MFKKLKEGLLVLVSACLLGVGVQYCHPPEQSGIETKQQDFTTDNFLEPEEFFTDANSGLNLDPDLYLENIVDGYVHSFPVWDMDKWDEIDTNYSLPHYYIEVNDRSELEDKMLEFSRESRPEEFWMLIEHYDGKIFVYEYGYNETTNSVS